VSALETLQFSTLSLVDDITKCVTLDCKAPGDLVYLIGETHNELGGSEYYEGFGYIGLNVPRARPDRFALIYRALGHAIANDWVASAHGIYRGGLGVHLAMVAMGGNLGLTIDLNLVPGDDLTRNDVILFSESAGRFILTVDPGNQKVFEGIFNGLPSACIGTVTGESDQRSDSKPCLKIKGIKGSTIVDIPVRDLKSAWQRPFRELV
jgi:phosphoribosylformylglycinamidine synthase